MVGVMKAKPRLSYATLASTLVGIVLISGCVREGAALVYQTKPSSEEHIPPASAVKKESEAGMTGRDTFDKMTLWTKETQLRGAKDLLKKVKTWFYFLYFDLDAILEDLIDSVYDMVVIEPIFTEKENEDYNIKEAVRRIKSSPAANLTNKLVLAYIDIGEAESYRYYWKKGWKIGDPDFIAGLDPDLWEDNFPVAFWQKE